jgi:hypothetical protein
MEEQALSPPISPQADEQFCHAIHFWLEIASQALGSISRDETPCRNRALVGPQSDSLLVEGAMTMIHRELRQTGRALDCNRLARISHRILASGAFLDVYIFG